MKEFKFKLYNQEWNIKFNNSEEIDNILDELGGNKLLLNWGFVDYGSGTIHINKDYPKETQLRTLLHELIHSFMLPNMGSAIHMRDRGVDVEIACSLIATSLIELRDQGLFTFDFENISEKKGK